MRAALRLLRTVRYLRLRQIAWRVLRRLRRVRLKDVTPRRRAPVGDWVRPVDKPSGLREANTIRLLNETVDLSDPKCWNDVSRSRLLLYHLHYLDELNAPSGPDSTARRRQLIDRWIAANPPVRGVGWEPYPLSLRIVNLIKWILAGASADEELLTSLHRQAQALSQQIEYHVLGNHILANAKALVYAGVFFEDADARRWLRSGSRLLCAEIDEQILADGGHFELSPMYHAIVLDDILDLINLTRCHGIDLDMGLSGVAGRMLDWLARMTHGDGDVAYFNDSTGGVAPRLDPLIAYAQRLGLHYRPPAAAPLVHLGDSGYVRTAIGAWTLIMDVGKVGPDYQPGHAHCDCLSFELSHGRQRVLVNTGVSTYADCHRRTSERSTRAHNTVSIEGSEQSEIWAAFRVGRRALPMVSEVSSERIVAAHDGFRGLGLAHRRTVSPYSGGMIIVDDMLGRHPDSTACVANFHFHPEISVRIDESSVRFDGGSIEFSGYDAIGRCDYSYCTGFNAREAATKIEVRFRRTLRAALEVDESGPLAAKRPANER